MFTQPLSRLLHETPLDLSAILTPPPAPEADQRLTDVVTMLAHRRGFLLPLPIHLRSHVGYSLLIESNPTWLPSVAEVLRVADQPLLLRVHLNGLLKKAVF